MNTDEIEIVDKYLALMGERDLEEAAKFLAKDARLEFPGRVSYSSLQEMVTDAATRYKTAGKHRDEFYVGTRASDGATTCISTGTLFGTTLWGTPFSGVRYIDLFIIHGGLIQEQYVWNDLADTGATPTITQIQSKFLWPN